MTPSKFLRCVGCAMGIAAFTGCASERPSAVGTTTTTGAGSEPNVHNVKAIQYVTATRCNREYVCNGIRLGGNFDSIDQCVRDVWSATRTQLQTAECAKGVGTAQLSRCLDDIRGTPCASPARPLEACQKSALCASNP